MEFVEIIFQLALFALEVFTWLVIVNVVSSWMFAFGVLNYSNLMVYKVMNFVYKLTEPVLTPVRSAIPSLGGMDISPIVVLLAIQGLRKGIIWLFFQLV